MVVPARIKSTMQQQLLDKFTPCTEETRTAADARP